MYTRYYDTYPNSDYTPNPNNIKDIAKEENEKALTQSSQADEPKSEIASFLPFGSLGGFKSDDILLIAVLLLILNECKDDNIMPIILGYILFSGGLF